MDEREIYRSAKRLIEEYGSGAIVQAAVRAGAMLERGDVKGAAIWERVIQAIYELRITGGETKH
jgi:hypothetical protein